jgi:hypothetical protein
MGMSENEALIIELLRRGIVCSRRISELSGSKVINGKNDIEVCVCPHDILIVLRRHDQGRHHFISRRDLALRSSSALKNKETVQEAGLTIGMPLQEPAWF